MSPTKRKRDTTWDNSLDVVGPGTDPKKKHPSISAAVSYAQGVACRATETVTISVREFEESLYHIVRDEDGVVITRSAA